MMYSSLLHACIYNVVIAEIVCLTIMYQKEDIIRLQASCYCVSKTLCTSHSHCGYRHENYHVYESLACQHFYDSSYMITLTGCKISMGRKRHSQLTIHRTPIKLKVVRANFPLIHRLIHTQKLFTVLINIYNCRLSRHFETYLRTANIPTQEHDGIYISFYSIPSSACSFCNTDNHIKR